MASRLLVLGSGELGTACALSLLANMRGKEATTSQAGPVVTMCARDRDYLHELRHGSRRFRVFDQSIQVPSRMSFQVMGESAEESGARNEALFLCAPVTHFAGGDAAALPDLLDCLGRHVDVPTFVFSRGLSRDGLTPQEELSRVICSRPSKLVVVSGPLFAREWAAASAHERTGGRADGNSGVSLAFAMTDETDAGTLEAVRALTERLWWRESITWLTEPAAARLLSLVNGCAPLCCMGAGMVSSEYPACVSAMMSYLQHAISATEKLVNDVLSRPRDTPLPACGVAALAMACTNQSSREFIFGRRLNYYFRHRDAVRAVFPGRSHESLDATVAGLHTLLTRRSLSSPFYEVLMDAFLTVLRASVAGRGLVKSGHYDYRHHPCVDDTPLFKHVLAVDDAVLSGDERRFDKARQALEKAFGDPPAPASPS